MKDSWCRFAHQINLEQRSAEPSQAQFTSPNSHWSADLRARWPETFSQYIWGYLKYSNSQLSFSLLSSFTHSIFSLKDRVQNNFAWCQFSWHLWSFGFWKSSSTSRGKKSRILSWKEKYLSNRGSDDFNGCLSNLIT